MKIKLITGALLLGMVTSSFAARVTKASVIQKATNKKSISLYAPWAGISGGVIDTAGLTANQRMALHGAIHQGVDYFHLKWDTTGLGPYEGNSIKFVDSTIPKGLALRDSLLALNPNLIIIGEMRVYDAIETFLPPNSPFWYKNGSGARESAFTQQTATGPIYYYKLAVDVSGWQQQVAKQCAALLETGIFDACLMDWATNSRLGIIQAVRNYVGEDAMLIGNVNHNPDVDKIMPLLNGGYMECVWWGPMMDAATGPGVYMNRVQQTLILAKQSMREPKIIGTEIWSHPTWTDLTTDYKVPENQKYLMRAGVALHYAYVNGYVSYFPQSFAKAPFLSEHMHVYDQFFNASLGQPSGETTVLINKSIQREWTKATVVYNPPGNGDVTVTFTETRRSQKSGNTGTSFTVPGFDGDIFLKGTYTQIYPVKGTGLPNEYPLPDTTYKSGGVSSISTLKAKSTGAQLQMLNNKNKPLFKFQVEGEAARFYNSEGREVQIPEGVQKP